MTRLEEYSFHAVFVSSPRPRPRAVAKTLRGQVIGVPGHDDAHLYLTDEPVDDRTQFLR